MKKTAFAILLLLMISLTGCYLFGRNETETAATEKGGERLEPASEQESVPASRQLTDRWLSGDLSDLAGYPEGSAGEGAGGMLGLLLPYTQALLGEIPEEGLFPAEALLTVTTPDLAAILTELGYESYTDSQKLSEDVQAVLQKGGYPERTVEVTVTVEKTADGYHVSRNMEAFFAFYGGLAELYQKQYEKYLEELGEQLGGQES